ncbi:MAG: response regulator transcription factor [Kiritimatiellae bacterium]|nr:response regulator transcription factor [Kiritimatiellia bacterium]
MKKPIRILIADDHAVVRRGLHSLIQTEKDLLVIGEASNGIEAVESTLRLKPDVVIMDLIMPEKSGAEAIAEIMAQIPETRIIILTTFGTVDDMARAIESGAAGALLKTSDENELIAAIRTVAANGYAISSEVQQLMAENPPAPQLTSRQLEVLNSMSQGFSNADIAGQLGIKEFSVREHVAGIMAKLEASNRAEAVAIALRKRLIEL